MIQHRPAVTLRLLPALLLILAGGGPPPVADEPGPDPSFLESYAATYRFRLGRPSSIRPAPDGRSVLFLRSSPRSFVHDLYELDVSTGEERVLLTAETILQGAREELTAEEKARRERQRQAGRGIVRFSLSRDGSRILVPLAGRLFVIERPGGEMRELRSDAGPPVDARLSPDGKQVACVRNGDLYVTEIASGVERRLTGGAGGSVTHGLAEFVAQEEMSRSRGFWWSPDSVSILYQRTDTAGLEIMNIMDATRPEQPPQTWPYPRPGKKNADVRLGLVPVAGGPTTWIQWDRERYEYLTNVRWQSDAPLTIAVQNRRQTELRLLAVDTTKGTTSPLLVERDEGWIEIDEKMPRWLPDGSGFLWTTWRRGAPQLELRGRDGDLRRVITAPDLGFRSFLGHVPTRRAVRVLAGREPSEQHVFEVPLDPDSGPARPLTGEQGRHGAATNRSGTLTVLALVPLAGPRRWELHGEAGPLGLELKSSAETPPFTPSLELTTIGTDSPLHAVLIRPRGFVADRAYPVIVHVYGGPTSLMVRADPMAYLLDQWMADHGYVVVAIDGRGTPHRGRDWQQAVKNDLIEVPLQDQARGLRLLGARYPELDLERVGIYGWSFGGYFSAMAVMRHPELFHAAVAGAPVVDWMDYDTHYTERYMDLPRNNPAGYRSANVLTYAAELSRPLLLIHGTADDNVYFMHSLKLADALFRAGRPFEFLPLSGFTHMVPDPLVTQRLYGRIMDFLDSNLRGDQPPDAPVGRATISAPSSAGGSP